MNSQPPTNVVIWGAKGHAKVLAELFALTGHRVVALFDNDPNARSPLPNVPLFLGWTGFSDWADAHDTTQTAFTVAIGGDRGQDRLEIASRLLEAGLTPASAIHPSAYVSPTARAAADCQVLANSTIGIDAQLGSQTIINTAATIDHECQIGAGVHIGPGATLAGCVTVGECSFIGAGATVLPRIRIGRHVTIGAGAVVTRDIADHAIAYGVPARIHSHKAELAHA